MLFCLARRKLDATITSQVSTSLTINSPRERKEEREETSFMHFHYFNQLSCAPTVEGSYFQLDVCSKI